jgi:hypothetical protein
MNEFSTVLFVNGAPVGYKVSRNADLVLLNPAENPSRTVVAPHLSARQVNGSWEVEGTQNSDLISQVIQDVSRNGDFDRKRIVLSAAP